MRWALFVFIFLVIPIDFGSAQEYNAILKDNGEIEISPKVQGSATGNSWAEVTPRTNDTDPQSGTGYLWIGGDGAIKGAFQSKEEFSRIDILPGEEIRAVEFSPEFSSYLNNVGFDVSGYREIATKAGIELLQAAKDAACSMEPKPETITPNVEVSFSLFAGGKFSIEATWRVSDLCK